MQVENFDGDDFADTPTFNIVSKDGIEPKTWGLDVLSEAGGSPSPSVVQKLSAVPSTLLMITASTSKSAVTTTTGRATTMASSTTTTLSSATTSSFPTVSPTTSNQQPEQSSGGSLDIHDKVAIGIGIGIGVPVGFATMLGTWITWKQYWRKKHRDHK